MNSRRLSLYIIIDMKYGRGKKNNLPYLSLALFLMIYNICAKLFLFRMLLSYNLKGLMSYNLKGLMSYNLKGLMSYNLKGLMSYHLKSLSIVTLLPISRYISRTGANRHACTRECQSFLSFARQQTIRRPF